MTCCAADELVGRVAATSLRTGTWLQRRHVRRPTVQTSPDVRARDQVRVVAARGALTVALSGGVALESGRVGDSIRVRNPSSGQILTARSGRVIQEVCGVGLQVPRGEHWRRRLPRKSRTDAFGPDG